MAGFGAFFRRFFDRGRLPERYQTLSKFDDGRMSTLYRALDRETMRPCLLKIYKPDCTRIRDAIRRKQPNIDEILTSLSHPNVMKTYEFGVSRGRQYAVIEIIDGKPLGQLVRERNLPLPVLLEIFAVAAGGLAYLHEAHSLVHRDLNPNNILATATLSPKIIDLDFAIVECEDTSGLFRRSGTVAYLSPEQVRGRGLNRLLDIYAFGVTMYETLAGVNPYVASDIEDFQRRQERTTYNHLVLVPEPPSTLRREIPPDLDELVLGCLTIDRSKRIQSAAEIRDRLRDIAAGL